MRVPYYIGELNMDLNSQNYLYVHIQLYLRESGALNPKPFTRELF